MRQIKFRAWDIFGEKMDYDVFLDPNGKVAAFSPLYGFYVRGCSDDEMKLMQFTGLCDSNSQEIYEGDITIAKFRTSSGVRITEKAVITFYTNAWCTDMSPFYPLAREGWIRHIAADDELEVIGNIYEHPHLLQEGDSKDA